MKWLLLLTLGGSVAQSSLVQVLSVGGATPDLPFILTVFWALRRGPEAELRGWVDAALAWCGEQDVDYIILWPTARSRTLYGRKGFAPTDAIMAEPLMCPVRFPVRSAQMR